MVSSSKKGYSGVAILTKPKPLMTLNGFGNDKFDSEGRVIIAEYNEFYLLSVYFPNGQMNEDRLKYKLEFYEALFEYCEELKKENKDIIICGDYNTAHTEIDLARPKENETVSGFLPIEREWMDKIINQYGYVDTFRHFNKEKDNYTWWSFRTAARSRNIGWRIDYVFTTKECLAKVDSAFIQQDVMGSDHCPTGITINAH